VSQEFNGFDAIGGLPDEDEVALLQANAKSEYNQHCELLHQVFEQNPLGKRLLNDWKDMLAMTPSIDSGSTQFEAGLNEGEKRFVRNIIISVKSIEE
tara:strand:- start:109 stop:399 length:291 start_codon:yes stop_codon:yes gene_type:complete